MLVCEQLLFLFERFEHDSSCCSNRAHLAARSSFTAPSPSFRDKGAVRYYSQISVASRSVKCVCSLLFVGHSRCGVPRHDISSDRSVCFRFGVGTCITRSSHSWFAPGACGTEEEAYRLYTELFAECSLETGKHLSKAEREQNQLTDVKVGPSEYICVSYVSTHVSIFVTTIYSYRP